MVDITDEVLIEKALEARKAAYTPYSHFQVGAALLTKGGKIYTGCNIENAAYTPTVCAERTAFFKAVSEGEREFKKIAVAGSMEGEVTASAFPCGVCRQVMQEFCNAEEFELLIAISPSQYERYTLKEILPFGFGPENLK